MEYAKSAIKKNGTERNDTMQNINHRELARRLVVHGIEQYKERFLLEEDLLSGLDRQKVLDEIEDIEKAVKLDDRRKLIAERDMYKKLVSDLEERLKKIYSLEDWDEEFEM